MSLSRVIFHSGMSRGATVLPPALAVMRRAPQEHALAFVLTPRDRRSISRGVLEDSRARAEQNATQHSRDRDPSPG